MTAAPFWDEQPGPWDTLILGGITLPGIARVSGRVSRKVDVRSPPGGDGARVRDRGYEPARIEAELRTWTKAQLEQLTAALETLHPRGENASIQTGARGLHATVTHATAVAPALLQDPATIELLRATARRAEAERRAEAAALQQNKRTPVDAIHPSLSMLGIRSVYITAVSLPELQNGQLTTSISMVEWTPKPGTAPRPATSSTSSESRPGQQSAFAQHRAASRPTATPPARLGGRT